ncbi:ABC-type cobalt transport system, permease component CbiQ and related transporters [Propionibacterium australiense]|uniref:Cobalt transport protein n=1 Tax=Propionibacterium australiense TaxID=119981 RepID=A0A383S6K3_9ACTN|nr:Cobalt transport protein [Propionibacterium australiense]VEH89756.1 ABC-type cobalt transport system, permease component CbiQ and related transporters [Propionibacterium australiense]
MSSRTRSGAGPGRLPPGGVRLAGRTVHPWAWWAWALCAAATVSLTTNPWLIGLVCAAVLATVLRRRSDEPWAHSLGVYLSMAGFVLVMRIFFATFFSATRSGTLLWDLPQLSLPAWAAGIRVGGRVYLEPWLMACFDAMRLGAMLLCVGAANTLANPRRALRSVPAALYEVSVAVVIALTVAPQMVESLARVRRAQRLRAGAVTGSGGLARLVIPVLEDSVERAMGLARSMESRGFGRTRPGRGSSWGTLLGLLGAVCLGLGAFLMLGSSWPSPVWIGLLAAGALAFGAALRLAGRRLQVTHYRPDDWSRPEWVVLASGVVAVAATVGVGRLAPAALSVSMPPLVLPALHLLFVPIAAALAAPAVLTPPPPRVSDWLAWAAERSRSDQGQSGEPGGPDAERLRPRGEVS